MAPGSIYSTAPSENPTPKYLKTPSLRFSKRYENRMPNHFCLGGFLETLRRHQVSNQLEGALEPNHSGIIALVHAVDVGKVKEQIPEATKVTTAEVDEDTARDITEASKADDPEEKPAG